MAENFVGQDRREYLRYRHEEPVRYRVLSPANDKAAATKLIDAVSKNLSVSGVLFTSSYLPEILSLVVVDLDTRTTHICKEIEKNALMVGESMVGKVVRVEETEDGKFDVGVAFIKKSEKLPKEIKSLLK